MLNKIRRVDVGDRLYFLPPHIVRISYDIDSPVAHAVFDIHVYSSHNNFYHYWVMRKGLKLSSCFTGHLTLKALDSLLSHTVLSPG